MRRLPKFQRTSDDSIILRKKDAPPVEFRFTFRFWTWTLQMFSSPKTARSYLSKFCLDETTDEALFKKKKRRRRKKSKLKKKNHFSCLRWSDTWIIRLLGCPNKVPLTGWLKYQKCISSKFWKPEVQAQGAVRVDSFWGPSPRLLGGPPLPVSSRGPSSVPGCVLISFFFFFK